MKYRRNALGHEDKLVTSHYLYGALGDSDEIRQAPDLALFDAHIDHKTTMKSGNVPIRRGCWVVIILNPRLNYSLIVEPSQVREAEIGDQMNLRMLASMESDPIEALTPLKLGKNHKY